MSNTALFLRQRDLIGTPGAPGLLPFGSATLWRWVKLGMFPAPVRLGPNLVAWAKADIDTWIASRTTTTEVV